MKRNYLSKASFGCVGPGCLPGLMAACGMPAPAPAPSLNKHKQPKWSPSSGNGGETMTLFVGPNREPCVGVAPQVCFQVKETPRAITLFYGDIQGLSSSPAYEYELRREDHDPQSARRCIFFAIPLVEIVSKTPAATTATLEGTTRRLHRHLDGAGNLTLPYRRARLPRRW